MRLIRLHEKGEEVSKVNDGYVNPLHRLLEDTHGCRGAEVYTNPKRRVRHWSI